MAIKAPLVLSVQVGLPKTMGVEGATNPDEAPWTSAIFKEPVEGPVWLSKTGLAGDGFASSSGNPEQAALGYSAEHYAGWRTELKQPFLKHGSFGENLTISRLTEQTVCVGDTYSIGDAHVQVSFPRAPCWKLNRRFKRADMVERVHVTGWGGWYLRVLVEGFVERSNFVVLEERPFPEWTVEHAYRVYTQREVDRAPALELAAVPLLSEIWRRRLRGESQGK